MKKRPINVNPGRYPTETELRLLSKAIESHAVWRGEMVGQEDPDAAIALARFDFEVERMRHAMKNIRAFVKSVKRDRVQGK